MKSLNALTFVALATLSMTVACSKAEEPAAPSEVVPTASEAAPVSATANTLSPEALAFIATLTPEELAQARLSCVHPLDSAKANARIFPDEVAAQLASAPYIERSKLLASEPLKQLSLDQARSIMDQTPKFNPQSKPTDNEITGVQQCIMLAHHYAAELAAKS